MELFLLKIKNLILLLFFFFGNFGGILSRTMYLICPCDAIFSSFEVIFASLLRKLFFAYEYCTAVIILHAYKWKGEIFSLTRGCCFVIYLKKPVSTYQNNARVVPPYRLPALHNELLFLSCSAALTPYSKCCLSKYQLIPWRMVCPFLFISVQVVALALQSH